MCDILNEQKIFLLPYFGIFGYDRFIKIGDIPLYLLSLVTITKIAHGVIMYPLSFMFHDIQHSFEMFKKKNEILKYNDNLNLLESSNKNKITIIEILDKILKYNDFYGCFCKLVIFFYIHEHCYDMSGDITKIINILCEPYLYNFYKNRLAFIEIKFIKSINKELEYKKDLSKYTDVTKKYYSDKKYYDTLQRIYCFKNEEITLDNIRLYVGTSISLLCYMLNNSYINNDTELPIEKSYKYMKTNHTINIQKINAIVDEEDKNEYKYSDVIKYLSTYDFKKKYSSNLIRDRINVIDYINFAYRDEIISEKISNNILFIIRTNNNYLLLEISNNNKNQELKECIKFLLLSKYIPIHCKIIIIIELEKK